MNRVMLNTRNSSDVDCGNLTKSILLQIVVFVAFVAVALAAPADDSANAQILKYDSENIGIDGYRFEFETSDGTARQEQAELRNAGTDQEAIVVRGSYSYIGPDGTQYVINYVADENGFQPEGAHIPK